MKFKSKLKYLSATLRIGTFAEFLSVLFQRKTGAVGLVFVIAVTLTAILAPWIAPYDPYSIDLENTYGGPSVEHLLGTDSLGRDLLSGVIVGSRISLIIAVSSISIAGLVGTVVGLTAGYFGGAVDEVVGRIVDIIVSIPTFILAIVISIIVGSGITNISIAVGISLCPYFARVVRSCTLTIKQLTYVEAAKSIGASDGRVIFRHILPNIRAPILVLLTLSTATAIIVEASLSFLGFGLPPPEVTWGNIVSSGRFHLQRAPWISAFSGIAIMVTVLGFNMLGDALRDALDPKLQHEMRIHV